MSGKKYKALVARETADGEFERKIEECRISDLPEGDVLVKVHYAGLNYKDALSAHGHKGITRKFPHTPGVDASGVVEESRNDRIKPGDKVIVTSYDLGMNTPGGFGQYIRVPAEWVVPLPANWNLRQAMILGTGGFTAGLAIYKMQVNGQIPAKGKIVVTGSTGGVGSMAVALLAKNGYEPIAVTGKPEKQDYLRKLGAVDFLSREDVDDQSGKPLTKPRWAGAIDTVGGNTLSTLIKSCGRNGNIAVCGLVSSAKFETTVYPFILNGINVLGVETAETPRDIREVIWNKLSSSWKIDDLLEEMAVDASLEEIPDYMERMLEGKSFGRVVARHEGV